MCISLRPTYFVKRGAEVINTGESLKIPVGESVLGRVMNIFGDPIDGKDAIDKTLEKTPGNKPEVKTENTRAPRMD